MLNDLPKDVILIINSYLDYESKIWLNQVLEDKIESKRLSETTLVNHKIKIDTQKLSMILYKFKIFVQFTLIFEFFLYNESLYKYHNFNNTILDNVKYILEYEDEEEDLTYLKQIANKLLTKVQSCENVKIVIHYNEVKIIYD